MAGINAKNWFTENGGKDVLLTALAVWNTPEQMWADDEEPWPTGEPSVPLMKGLSYRCLVQDKNNVYFLTEKHKEDSSGEDSNESEEGNLTLEKESDLEMEATKYCKPEWPQLKYLALSLPSRPPE